MNLQSLMDTGVPPPVIADALFRCFGRIEQREIDSINAPLQFVFVCKDEDGTPRLAVLFGWGKGGWCYEAHSPKLLKTLRLCAGQ